MILSIDKSQLFQFGLLLKVLEGYEDENDFAHMKGYEPWANLLYKEHKENLHIIFVKS